MPVVGSVDVLIVKVVDVVIMAYLDMSAVLAVFVVVRFGGHVARGNALVVVPVVGMVQVPVVEVVDMADMFHRAMPAVWPVDVRVPLVDRVRGFRRHLWSSLGQAGLMFAWYPRPARVYPPRLLPSVRGAGPGPSTAADQNGMI